MSFTIFQNIKNDFLIYKNKKFKTSKNCQFCKGVNSWFWSKNSHFFNFFFLGNIGQENVFYHILERKKAFLGFKNEKFKNSKIGFFPKRLTQGFGLKIAICPTSFFQAKQARGNVFYDILERKNTFLGYKNKQFKNSKNCHFSKGVNPWFLEKNGLFDNFFFFSKIGHENVFCDILKQKKRLSRL